MDKSILKVVHESAKTLHDTGLPNEVSMREFDALCLPPVKIYSAMQIKHIRLKGTS
jgi:putative transcriptional regulator